MNEASRNGTIGEVAQFFRVSVRTVKRWNAERPPRIAFWRDGACLVYGEEDVCRYRAQHYVADRRLAPGEALELARREWRRHAHLRTVERGAWSVEDLVKRVEALEAVVLGRKAA
jgi:hypothetical protein